MRYKVKDLYGFRYAVVDTEKKDEQICICRKKLHALEITFAMNMHKGIENEKENKCNSKKD